MQTEKIIIRTEKTDNWFIIILYGKFVVKNLIQIRQAFEESEKYLPLKIAIDLSNVTQIDSSAITLLANFQKRLLEKGSGVVIFGATPYLNEIFSIVGLDKVIPINSNEESYERITQNKF
jgi:anti-anti-sigma factor